MNVVLVVFEVSNPVVYSVVVFLLVPIVVSNTESVLRLVAYDVSNAVVYAEVVDLVVLIVVSNTESVDFDVLNVDVVVRLVNVALLVA